MKNTLIVLFLISLAVPPSCKEKQFNLSDLEMGSAGIVFPDSANSIQKFAATELKKHLYLW